MTVLKQIWGIFPLEVQLFYKMISRPLNCKEMSDIPSSFSLKISDRVFRFCGCSLTYTSHGLKWNTPTQKKNMQMNLTAVTSEQIKLEHPKLTRTTGIWLFDVEAENAGWLHRITHKIGKFSRAIRLTLYYSAAKWSSWAQIQLIFMHKLH